MKLTKTCTLQMLGLNVYSYIDDFSLGFYKTQRKLAKKMDALDWLPGSYQEEILEGGEDPLARARRPDPSNEDVQRAPVNELEPLITVYPGDDEEAEDEVEAEEEEGEEEEEEEATRTRPTQQSAAPRRKKVLRTGTPQSKLVPNLTVDDARDMFSRDATAAFRERRSGKGKKLYNEYAPEETIAISSEDDDDRELAKRLRSDPPSPSAFAGMVRVKPEVLTVEEANERRLREEEQRLRREKVAAEESSMKEEVAQLRALLLSQEQQRARAPPVLDQAALVTSVLQGMWAQGLVMAPPSSFPHIPPGFPPQHMPPQPLPHQQFPHQPFVFPRNPSPHVAHHAQQMDDPRMWDTSAGPSASAPFPRVVPCPPAPHQQQDDPAMFRAAARNSTEESSPAESTPGDVTPPAAPQFRAPARNSPPAEGPQEQAVPAGVQDATAVVDGQVEQRGTDDTQMLDVEGPQGPGDTSIPTPVDEPMHDAHAETGLGQAPDPQPVQEQVSECEGVAPAVEAPERVEASATAGHDRDEVIH